MMDGPSCTGMGVAVLLIVAVAQAAAQASDGLQAADVTAKESPPQPFLLGSSNFPNRGGIFYPSVIPEVKAIPVNFQGRVGTSKDLEKIGGTMVDESGGQIWDIGRHSYKLREPSEGVQQSAIPIKGHTGKVLEAFRGEATREGPRHFEVSGDVEETPLSGYERDGSILTNSPIENKYPPIPGAELVGWSTEADLWKYQEGQWKEVHLPDPFYPSLPTPSPSAAAFVVDTLGKVQVERRLEGVQNVTIYFHFFLSDSHHPDTLPELEVYLDKDGSLERLPAEEQRRGVWQERIIHLSEADNSSVIIEGWLKAEGDIIALSNLYTTGAKTGRDEALDADSDQMTLTANTTENITSTYDAEGIWTEAADQDSPIQSQTDMSPISAEGNTEEGLVTEMPTDELNPTASTDISGSETQATDQVDGNTDVVTLNSSISGGDTMTSNDNVTSDFEVTDAENTEPDGEEKSTFVTVSDESSASENDTTDTSEINGKEDNTTLPTPDVTATDTLPTNASVTFPYANATATNNSFITTEVSVSPETPSVISEVTRFTDGQNLSTDMVETDKNSSGTSPERPESSATGNVTEESVFPGEVMMESTPFPGGNSTVVAAPVSSTSWQVFQIFLVLCVIGLLALGFLYWKRKRRQDDEIPVFTRHTDYHNPTFTMEDAANFMSRAGRNTYKTIE